MACRARDRPVTLLRTAKRSTQTKGIPVLTLETVADWLSLVVVLLFCIAMLYGLFAIMILY